MGKLGMIGKVVKSCLPHSKNLMHNIIGLMKMFFLHILFYNLRKDIYHLQTTKWLVIAPANCQLQCGAFALYNYVYIILYVIFHYSKRYDTNYYIRKTEHSIQKSWAFMIWLLAPNKLIIILTCVLDKHILIFSSLGSNQNIDEVL